jgi:RNA polymerase sigma-70 factor (ECF subfamily)
MDAHSDGSCLERWVQGDPQAFEELVRRHEGALLRHGQALVGNRRDAEDVVQEAFLRLAQKPPTLPPEVLGDADKERGALASWLHRVTRNLCMDALRSETRRRRREEEVASHEAVSGGLRRVEEDDTREAVARTLERLPEDQREVLVLRLLGERSYKEIAAITGKKIGTIGWLISVGLKALSQELAPLLSMQPVPAHSSATQAARLQGDA